MRKFNSYFLNLFFLLALGLTPQVFAQQNPCNPCSGKKAANPCSVQKGSHFKVQDPMNRNHVTFKSTAPLEDIVGTTRSITGHIVIDPNHPERGGHGELTVPVNSINTGIPLRNEHLKSADWLDAETYPHIKLMIRETKNLKQVKSSPQFQTFDVTLVGDFSLRGKTRRVEIPGRFTILKESEMTRQAMPGDILAARADFTVQLADYGIEGPAGNDLIGAKVGEEIEVEVSFRASNAAGAGGANPCGGKVQNPCNPCGAKAQNPCNPCGSK